jgi:large subunit ribosomal protein L4
VYLANQREGSASTKTRGEVIGSTRKIYKQKGTGNARHGALTAPIFVGGGVALGPRPKSFRLELPKKMKKQALASALTYQYQEGSIKVVDQLDKLPLKTKSFAQTLSDLSCTGKTLVILTKEEQTMRKALRNISTVDILPVSDIHTYAIMNHAHIVFSKQAVTELVNN